MNTNDLKILEAVAEKGSFTKAAEAMFTVQSNVTARIKNLEDEFGASLFNRTSRRVELTVAGEKLMYYAKQISHLIGEAKREIAINDTIFGQLKIGCIETTMALKAPELIHDFMELYPDVDLEFKSSSRSGLIQDVCNYKLDAAFVPAPINASELEQVMIKEEQLVILASSAITDINAILSGDPLKIIVFDQGCVFRARLESWLNLKGVVHYKDITVNSIEGIINFVESGLGISILPADVITQYYANRKINTFSIGKESGTVTTLLVYRKDIPVSRPLKAFIEMHSSALV